MVTDLDFVPDRLGRATFVAVMQSTNFWDRDNATGVCALTRSALGGILREREVGARLVVVREVLSQ